MPKALKTRKLVTNRIVTKEDIQNLLEAIEQAYAKGRIDYYHYQDYKAIVLFGAFTGQRPLATIARMTIGQLKVGVDQEKPVLTSCLNKIRFACSTIPPCFHKLLKLCCLYSMAAAMMSSLLPNCLFKSGSSSPTFDC